MDSNTYGNLQRDRAGRVEGGQRTRDQNIYKSRGNSNPAAIAAVAIPEEVAAA
jgi:hypothetical protein